MAREWRPTRGKTRASTASGLDIAAANVNSVTIDPLRAHVTCAAQLAVATDGPLTITLAGCGRVQTFGP
jgi:hypothetical protein